MLNTKSVWLLVTGKYSDLVFSYLKDVNKTAKSPPGLKFIPNSFQYADA